MSIFLNTQKNHTKGNSPPNIAAVLLVLFFVLSAVTLTGGYQTWRRLPLYVGKQLTETEMEEVIARNSPLTTYVHLSPNASFPRETEIKKITIHHMAANLTLEELGDSFGCLLYTSRCV